MLDERSEERTRWGRNPGYILSGIIKCALCGQAYAPASTRREKRVHLLNACKVFRGCRNGVASGAWHAPCACPRWVRGRGCPRSMSSVALTSVV
jgi:hypothetical protein